MKFKKARRFPVFRIALAFLLSCLPLIVLSLDASNEHQRQTAELLIAQKYRFKILAEKVSRQSEITYWAEEIGRRQKRGTLQHGPTPLKTFSAFSNAMGEATANAHFTKLPKAKFWGVFFPNSKSRKGNIALHPDLSKEDSAFFERLLFAMAKNRNPAFRKNGEARFNLDSTTWKSQIELMFGHFVSPILFTDEYRGKAFHVIYNRSPGILLWDFFSAGGILRGAMVIFHPLPPNFEFKPLALTLNHWKEPGIKPAFLPFPVGRGNPESYRVLAHHALRKTGVPGKLVRWGRRLKVIPFNEQTHSAPSIHTGIPNLFQLQPLDDQGKWVSYFFPISPLSGHLGALVCQSSQAPPHFIENLSFFARVIVLFSWLLILMRYWLFRSFPQIGIQSQLLFWVIGLLGMPAALSFGAMVRLSGDITSNRLFELQTDLVLETKKLEASANRITEKLEELLRKACDDKTLLSTLDTIRLHRTHDQAFLDDFANRLTLQGVSPTAIFILGPKGFFLEKYDSTVSVGFRNIFRKTFKKESEVEFSGSVETASDENKDQATTIRYFAEPFSGSKKTVYSMGRFFSFHQRELSESMAVKFRIIATWNEVPLFRPTIEEAQKDSALHLEGQGISTLPSFNTVNHGYHPSSVSRTR